ncbi:hypothetical protein L228DRAFT_243736 [Xylona heveae TC161]|uniref:Uncharacterized protein n=1 Tax=Xylona heveae (strain CBS 132557 / TC161) TaxID=1328760 RepID=A0A161TFW2_XYLHT|nr:hypothetical protein L228DRAFT_243736 [Xylona heveae TC161]KZF24977.1 hypothetical protein L228DRAFT_243736 [Xylona heveae TC161]
MPGEDVISNSGTKEKAQAVAPCAKGGYAKSFNKDNDQSGKDSPILGTETSSARRQTLKSPQNYLSVASNRETTNLLQDEALGRHNSESSRSAITAIRHNSGRSIVTRRDSNQSQKLEKREGNSSATLAAKRAVGRSRRSTGASDRREIAVWGEGTDDSRKGFRTGNEASN